MSPVSPFSTAPGRRLNVSQIEGDRPPSVTAPSIWYDAVAAPHRKSGGNRRAVTPSMCCCVAVTTDLLWGELTSADEGEPVDVDEVGRLAAGEGEIHGVYAGHRRDVRRDRAPGLPAAGVGD